MHRKLFPATLKHTLRRLLVLIGLGILATGNTAQVHALITPKPTTKLTDEMIQQTKEQYPLLARVLTQLKKGVQVAINQKNETDDRTALHEAACLGDKAIIQVLLAQGAQVNVTTTDKYTPLHWVALNGHQETVKLLLDHGAKIGVKTNHGHTPLHLAALNVHQDVVAVIELLLDHSAEIEVRDNYGYTPLHWAVLEANQAVKNTEYEHTKTWEQAFNAEQYYLNQYRKVAYLITQGANINVKDNHGYTPLHLAALLQKPAFTELLLDHSAEIEVRDNYGYTPLHRAVLGGDQEVVQLLLDQGANINAKVKRGSTPLHLAVLRGDQEVVQLLLDQGANKEATDNEGRTAYDWANLGLDDLVSELDPATKAKLRPKEVVGVG